MGNKYETNEKDIKKVRIDFLSRSLFHCILNTKKNCRNIDRRINGISKIQYIPWERASDRYDTIIELMSIKSDLVAIYKLFKNWYKGLKNEQHQKIFVAYYVKQNTALAKKISDNYHRIAINLADKFMEYVKKHSGYTEFELIKNPFVYDSYICYIEKIRKQSEKQK